MPETAAELEARIQDAISPGFQRRLLDRGLARGLIWRDGALPPGAPSFSTSLTEDLLDFAHTILFLSLRLRQAAPNSTVLPKAFLVAGEAIEAAVHRGDATRPDAGFHRITAAVAFHLARYAARAYSILPTQAVQQNLSPSERALLFLLRRRFDELHDAFSAWLMGDEHHDEEIAARLAGEGDFDDGDACHEVLTTAFMRALALFDHALATGDAESALRARDLMLTGASAAADLHSVPHWWTFMLASHLIDDLWGHSLHEHLPELPPEHPAARWNLLRRNYIIRLRRRSRASVELWPSQTEGAHRAIDPTDSLVIALPTSAGKTRIAEICILRSLAADRRVVYITPLRALSAQVERDLSSTFGPLGYSISSLYGAAGIEAVDTDALRTDELVVATPEKIDFALRNDPEIIDDVGLIVLDEGHMLGPGEREVRYEALVQRLLRRDDAPNRRIVCLSALFPEAEKMADFVAWIRRDVPGDLVHSVWRPTRQRYGWIRWEHTSARLEVRVEGEESFVPRFVEAQPPPRGRRKKGFPQNKNELTLAAAWQFVNQDKDVLIYSPLKKSVETLGALVLKCIHQGVLTSIGRDTERVREAMAAGAEWIGADHPAVLCLEHGVAVHHGGLPRQFLAHVERLLRKGDCRITIASPTLAQGLNLSASVLLVPSIWRSGRVIPAVELANVAGRAGRAFVDLEGLVLHIVWEPKIPRTRWALRNWQELLARAKATEVSSGLLELTGGLFKRIASTSGLPIEEVVDYVLGQDSAWDYSEIEGTENDDDYSAADWERDVASLDAAILALLDAETEEEEIEEQLDVVLEGSLFTRQLEQKQERVQKIIRGFLAARARRMWSGTSSAQRQGYHVAGVGLLGGRYLDAHLEDLVSLLRDAETAIATEDVDGTAEAIAAFASLVFETAPFRPQKLPAQWRDALIMWVHGRTAAEVVKAAGEDGVEFLQEGIMYRLAWATEAVRVHALSVELEGAEEIEGQAALAVETGSALRPVMTLLRSGLRSREAAQAAVQRTGATFADRLGMLEWVCSDEVRTASRAEDWPSPGSRSAWQRFVESLLRAVGLRWTTHEQVLKVIWSVEEVPRPGTSVVLEPDPDDGDGWVLDPSYVKLGVLSGQFERPHEQVVAARVGEQRGTVEVEFFGADVNREDVDRISP